MDHIDNDDDHHAQLEKTGFWGKQAAGCLFLAKDTGRLLIAHRSEFVLEPGTWGTWGGAVDHGETPRETVAREVYEEAGLTDQFDLVELAVFKHESGFRYHNFLTVVEKEFDPALNWETQGYAWVEVSDLKSKNQRINPMHPGMDFLLSTSLENIEQAVASVKAHRFAEDAVRRPALGI